MAMRPRQPARAPTKRHVEPVRAPEAPSFIGGACRKRKLELMGERGLLAPGMYNPASAKGAPLRAAPTASKTAARAAPLRAAPANGVRWIQVGEQSPLVAEQGLPELAPSILQDEAIKTLMSQSTNILYEVVGMDVAKDEIQLIHDERGETYPEVTEAVKAAGGPEAAFIESCRPEDTPVCIAICGVQQKWAVGMAGNWKKREQAAKLALAVALAANKEDFSGLAKSQPEFTMFCETSGIATDTDLGSLPPPQPREAPAPQPSKKRKAQADVSMEPVVKVQDPTKLPRETPMWIVVEEGLPDVLQAYTPEAIAVATDKDKMGGLAAAADKALPLLLEDPVGHIEYADDFNWETFGAVGNALKKIAPAEECLCVAICAAKECWAVGIGMQSKARYAAAKVALTTALALRAADEDEDIDLSENSHIAEFVEKARAARDA